MIKFTVNTIGFGLVAIGAATGVQSFIAMQSTGVPLIYAATGVVLLIITNLIGE